MSPPLPDHDDAALVLRFCHEGDVDAFEELYRRYTPRVVAIAERVTSSHAAAEEIAQETFLRAAQRYCASANESFGAWVGAVARHLGIDEVRRRQRRVAMPLDSREVDLSGSVDPWSRRSDLNLVVRLLDALPAHYRQALLLKEVVGLHAQEIAQEMDLTVSSVEKLVSRARGRLRTEYARAGG